MTRSERVNNANQDQLPAIGDDFNEIGYIESGFPGHLNDAKTFLLMTDAKSAVSIWNCFACWYYVYYSWDDPLFKHYFILRRLRSFQLILITLPGDLTSTRAVCVEKSQSQDPLITGLEPGTFDTRVRRSTCLHHCLPLNLSQFWSPFQFTFQVLLERSNTTPTTTNNNKKIKKHLIDS